MKKRLGEEAGAFCLPVDCSMSPCWKQSGGSPRSAPHYAALIQLAATKRDGFAAIMQRRGFLSIQQWKKTSGICERKKMLVLFVNSCYK